MTTQLSESMNRAVTTSFSSESSVLQFGTIRASFKEVPFKRRLSFERLIDEWGKRLDEDEPLRAELAKKVLETLQRNPDLLSPIDDLVALEPHQEFLKTMLSLVVPMATVESDIFAAFVPFCKRYFYATPKAANILQSSYALLKRGETVVSENEIEQMKTLQAYFLIYKTFYDPDFNGIETTVIIQSEHAETKLPRYYRININPKFIVAKSVGNLPILSENDKARLMNNVLQIQLWLKLLPPERFELHGFSIFNAVDVTDQEALSAIKRELIEKESIVSAERFKKLQAHIRIYFNQPDLSLGLGAMRGDEVMVLNYDSSNCDESKKINGQRYSLKEFEHSYYAKAAATQETVVLDDLRALQDRTMAEEFAIQEGLNTLVLAPLQYQGDCIGILKIGSPRKRALSQIDVQRLSAVLPLFSLAVKRAMEEYDTEIQAVIKERFTVIHPSVDWRFRQAAENLLREEEKGKSATPEEIVFHDVYSLYGATDVRGSSIQRNHAIQSDLAEQILMAQEILQLAFKEHPLPILAELVHNIAQKVARVTSILNSGEENAVHDFLARQVESHFAELETFSPEVKEKIQRYRASLDPKLGMLYKSRKAFDESITILNNILSLYIEEEQEKAQAMFPHYFEKQKSDGVDYTIYIGAALNQSGHFDMLYLRNLRLWQLMLMCGIGRRASEVSPALPVHLETAHLVLVQSIPISIRFRADEKQFDVDGAYNIRYEIIKKRIDKATIRGTGERLTQPHKLAVIYSQEKEIVEYRGYLDYLRATGNITGEIEELELSDMQGVQGLKALRVQINLEQR